MPRSKEFLLEQIARAQRFAQAMNTQADRERFEKMEADYRSELDAAEAAEAPASAAPPAPADTVQANGAAKARSETANSNATEPTTNAEGDQKPTTD